MIKPLSTVFMMLISDAIIVLAIIFVLLGNIISVTAVINNY